MTLSRRQLLAGTAAAVGGLALDRVPFVDAASVMPYRMGSQSWWRTSGLVIPEEVGEHVHLDVTVPNESTIVSGKVAFPVTITAHDLSGPITSFRVSDGSTVKQKWPVSLGANDVWSEVVTVDFDTWGTGRREMRWTANVPRNAEGKRQYQSTGIQVNVRATTPAYRSGPYLEARGWYSDRGYANARLTSTRDTIKPFGTIKVSLKPGSGGKPTKHAGIYIDPDFHAGSDGTVVREWSGPFVGSVALPAIAPGSHRLVMVSSDGSNAGVLAVPFEVAA